MNGTKTIAMVGVYADGRIHGGICSVIDLYRRSSLGSRYRILLSGNSAAGSGFRKAAAFVHGCCLLAFRCALGRVDLVHLHSASGISFYRKSVCFFIAKLFRKKTVFHIHGGGFLDFYRRSPQPVRALVRLVLDRSDAVITLSESFRESLCSITRNRRLVVVHNPINAAEYQSPTAGAASDGPSSRERRILFAGDLIDRKGVEELLQAMPAVVERFPDCRLILLGRGKIDYYRKQCDALGIGKNVTFVGFVTGAEKIRAFTTASLFVLPSWVEGMPMVIIEAMAAGLPVVATRVGGIPEIIDEGLNGLLLPSLRDSAGIAQRIVRILDDRALHASMSAANMKKAREQFDIAVIAEQVDALYRGLT